METKCVAVFTSRNNVPLSLGAVCLAIELECLDMAREGFSLHGQSTVELPVGDGAVPVQAIILTFQKPITK